MPCALYQAHGLNLIAEGIPSFLNAEELVQLADAPIDTRQLADYILGASCFRYAEIISAAET